MTRRSSTTTMDKEIVDVDASSCRRIGFVSDSHGAIDDRVVAALKGCDFLVHAGDLGCRAALETLREIAPTTAVRGNNDTVDRWPQGEFQTVQALPLIARITLSIGYVVVIHGHQHPQAKKRHQQLRDRFSDALAVVYGHSHRLVMDKAHSPWVLNPGACGRARTYGGPSGLILALGSRRWEVLPIRFPTTR